MYGLGEGLGSKKKKFNPEVLVFNKKTLKILSPDEIYTLKHEIPPPI